MIHAITARRMRAMEQAYIAASGTPGLLLMERAAQAVANAALRMTESGILVLCGPGNNGGDGFAAARLLHEQGRTVWVWVLSDPEKYAGDARVNLDRLPSKAIAVTPLSQMPTSPPDGCGLIIDALFGTGLDRPLEGLYAQAVAWINAQAIPCLAVDMPSGMGPNMVRTDATVTFHQSKVTHWLFPGRSHTGTLHIADIGLPDAPSGEDYAILQPEDIPALLPARPLDVHKGTAGQGLIYAGSLGMAGAAALCANAALRGGAGLVRVAAPPDVLPTVQQLAPCATCILTDQLCQAASGTTAIAAGPGLGSAGISPALEYLRCTPKPQVWDADALNWLAQNPARLTASHILTPHPGEAARLLKASVQAITADPTGAAEALHAATGAVILLKGATTVILGAGRRALNITGSPGMATGGSGDVLTGLILALLCQGLAPFDAAQLGALLHGMAGQQAAAQRGIRSMTAWDLMEAIHID